MSEYTGEKCIICDKEFQKNDDIVVCPDCGTPYHRDCYEKEGKCINTELHSKGGSWQKERVKKIEEELKKALNNESNNEINIRRCPNCNNPNPPTSHFCSQCGAIITPSSEKHIPNMNEYNNTSQPNTIFNIDGINININDKCCGFDPNEDFDGVKLSEIANYVGSNQIYYIPMFKRMKDTGRKLFLNLTCVLFPQYFFANRKCYILSLLSIIIMFIIGIPSSIDALSTTSMLQNFTTSINTTSNTFQNIILLATILMYAFRVGVSLFGNWFYYRHTIKAIKSIKQKNESNEINLNEIKSVGGVRPMNIVFAIVIELFLQSGILCLLKFI